jgi:D-alanine--D-alanine ligase
MKIAVLCGGLSNERDVSISSGTGIARALRECGHRVALVDLFYGREELSGNIDSLFTAEETDTQFRVGEDIPDLNALRAARAGKSVVGPHVLDICAAADITFMALHGEEGENGKVQAMLDMHGIRYTGSGYLGSAIAMNKSLTKILLQEAGVPVPGGMTIKRGDIPYDNPGFPCVVKPCSGGSSVGTTIVTEKSQYDKALETAFRYEDSVIAECYIVGRELTVGVINGEAMPVIEIIPKAGFYDYKNKYQPGLTQELCPAPITPEQTLEIQRLSVIVHKALRIDVYSRVDFIMDKAGCFWCLEANTLPGMTPTSLIPQMGAVQGLSFGELCEKLIRVSMEKYQ